MTHLKFAPWEDILQVRLRIYDGSTVAGNFVALHIYHLKTWYAYGSGVLEAIASSSVLWNFVPATCHVIVRLYLPQIASSKCRYLRREVYTLRTGKMTFHKMGRANHRKHGVNRHEWPMLCRALVQWKMQSGFWCSRELHLWMKQRWKLTHGSFRQPLHLQTWHLQHRQ